MKILSFGQRIFSQKSYHHLKMDYIGEGKRLRLSQTKQAWKGTCVRLGKKGQAEPDLAYLPSILVLWDWQLTQGPMHAKQAGIFHSSPLHFSIFILR